MAASGSAWWEKVAYALGWPLSAALVLVDGFVLRGALLKVLARLGEGKATAAALDFGWLVEFLDRAYLLAVACAGAGLAVYFEHHYRKGLQQGALVPRLLGVLGIELGVLILGAAIQLLW